MDFLLDPLVIECILVVCVTVAGLVIARRLRRIAQKLNSITALSDFIAGLNDYFRGDHDQAVLHLEKAVAADPRNVEARIALGDCYREKGDLAEAHKHHTHVRTTFGVDEVENLRSLAKDHELRGDLESASECMSEVHTRLPDDLDAARDLRRLHVATGEFSAAIPVQQRILATLEGSVEAVAERHEEERELARLYALAGEQLLERNDPRGALSYLEHAVRIAPDLIGARMNLVRATAEVGDDREARSMFGDQMRAIAGLASESGNLELLSAGASQATAAGHAPRALLPSGGSTQALLPAATTTTALVASSSGSELVSSGGGAAALQTRGFLAAVLPRVAALRCNNCGHAASQWEELCPECEAPGSLYSIYTHERRSVPELVDMLIEATGGAEHHRRLLAKVEAGDQRAAGKLSEQGEDAVGGIMNELASMKNPERAVEILADMGLGAFGQVLDHYCRLQGRQSLPRLGSRVRGIGSYEDVVTEIARRLGGEVLPIVYERLRRNQSTLAPLACRLALTLADASGVDAHRDAFETRMILAEVRSLSTAEAVRLLAATEPTSPLVEDIFADAAWKGDPVLAHASKDPGCRKIVVATLRRRGVESAFVAEALELLRDDDYARVLLELLGELDRDGLLFIEATTDSGVSASVRARLSEELASRQGSDLTPLVEHLGGATLAAEAELREVIASRGSTALDSIRAAFDARGGRLLGALRPFARRQDRQAKLSLAAALGECVRLGTEGARELCLRLEGAEDDTDVKRALGRAADAGMGS